MSALIGKKNSTLKKEQVKESKLLSTGVKAIKFWHEAQSDGETSIPFGSLVLPSDISSNGLSNPTPTEILAANLALFHTNVEVHSSLNQKLMEGLAYVVRNNQIKFINGYESVEGEIFAVVYKNDVITGTNVVDARPLTATGVLTAGNTDFNVGEAFKTNAFPSDQLGEVLVFVDGLAQFRNTGNATAAPAADGNYEEVHSTNGFGTIIRFNDTFGTDKNIQVISRSLIAERPDISMMQLIENLGGQLDSVIETVADLAGVDESEFQANPNQVDLKAFGSQVNSNTVNINSILDVEVFDEENRFDLVLDHTPSTSTWAIDRKSPQDFLDTSPFSATGTTFVTLAFKPGFFTEPPAVQVTGDNTVAGGNEGVVSTSVTTSGCTVFFESAVGSKLTVQISRTGGDYKVKRSIRDILGL